MKIASAFLLLAISLFSTDAQVSITSCHETTSNLLPVLKDLQTVKFLVSNRDDIKLLLASYRSPGGADYNNSRHRYWNDDVEIDVYFSRGNCSENADDEDDEIWDVDAGKVTSIEIMPDEPLDIKSVGVDLSGFTKERKHNDFTGSFIFHDKKRGIAFETDHDEIVEIRLFPPASDGQNLCGNNPAAKKLFHSKSWYGDSQLKDRQVISCYTANVTDLSLSSLQFVATSEKGISITTTAETNEHDILKYAYTVSGGQIVGQGPKVVWNVSGLAPGSYTITAAIDDGCGFCGRTVTKTIVVK